MVRLTAWLVTGILVVNLTINQQEAKFLSTIINAKYLKNLGIITLNRGIEDWNNIFTGPIMANAILDRLAHNAY